MSAPLHALQTCGEWSALVLIGPRCCCLRLLSWQQRTLS